MGLSTMVRSKDEPVPEHAYSRLRHTHAVLKKTLYPFKLQAMKRSPSPHWKLLHFAVSLLRHAFIVCQPTNAGAAFARIGGHRHPAQRQFNPEPSSKTFSLNGSSTKRRRKCKTHLAAEISRDGAYHILSVSSLCGLCIPLHACMGTSPGAEAGEIGEEKSTS